jgi:hypothetical protein
MNNVLVLQPVRAFSLAPNDSAVAFSGEARRPPPTTTALLLTQLPQGPSQMMISSPHDYYLSFLSFFSLAFNWRSTVA